MKKIYFILAAIAMVSMFSCKKDDNKKKGGDDSGDGSAIIAIDGKFDDWKALGSKVAVCELPDVELASYEHLLLMKAVGDEDYIYLYFEFALEDGQAVAPFDVFFDSDANPATGFISWIWNKEATGWDFLCESEQGFLASNTAIRNMDDMGIYKAKTWKNAKGEQLDGWDDGEESGTKAEQEKLTTTGFAENAGVVEQGVAKFEVSIARSAIGATKKSVGIGVTMSNAAWKTLGILPQKDETGGLGGDFLSVTLP